MILEEYTECAVILTRKLLSNQGVFCCQWFFLLFSSSKTWPTLAISWRNLPFPQLGDKSTEKDKVLHPNVFTGNHQVLHLFLFQVVEHLVVVFQTAIRLKMPLNFLAWSEMQIKELTRRNIDKMLDLWCVSCQIGIGSVFQNHQVDTILQMLSPLQLGQNLELAKLGASIFVAQRVVKELAAKSRRLKDSTFIKNFLSLPILDLTLKIVDGGLMSLAKLDLTAEMAKSANAPPPRPHAPQI